jgi:CTP:molybdopterin cytidylyltransferase MocA
MQNPHALLLAAGAARRFGTPKALALLNGRSLIELAAARAQDAAGDAVTIVLGAHATDILARVHLPAATICHHTGWSDGLAESLKCGLQAVPTAAPAVLVTLVDQPLVTADHLRQLIQAWRTKPSAAAVAEYAGGIGAPCVLPRGLFTAVSLLSGDRGARALLRALPEVTRVAIPEAEFDVDTPADLAALISRGAGS